MVVWDVRGDPPVAEITAASAPCSHPMVRAAPLCGGSHGGSPVWRGGEGSESQGGQGRDPPSGQGWGPGRGGPAPNHDGRAGLV